MIHDFPHNLRKIPLRGEIREPIKQCSSKNGRQTERVNKVIILIIRTQEQQIKQMWYKYHYLLSKTCNIGPECCNGGQDLGIRMPVPESTDYHIVWNRDF